MATVRIPYPVRAKDAQTLVRCLEHAARETGMLEHDVAIAMTCFLEQCAVELAKGRPVKIPGFGSWIPYLHQSRREGSEDFVRVRFVPSRSLAQEVRYAAATPIEGRKRIVEETRNNWPGSRGGKSARSTVFRSMSTFRQALRNQISRDA